MKNIAAILLNTGYWVIFMINVSMFYYAMTTQELVISLWPKVYWRLSTVVYVPSVVAFYIGYIYIFAQLETKVKKRVYLLGTLISISLVMGVIWTVLNKLIWNSQYFGLRNEFLFFIQKGLPLSLLWFVHMTCGLLLRVFLKWFNNLDESSHRNVTNA